MLDFRIITFLTVCEYMNFTKAAQALNLSQPNVSQHIRFLEEKYQCVLFTREKKQIKLTDQGKILYSVLKSMRNDETKIIKLIQENSCFSQKFSFGMTMTLGAFTLTKKLISFIKENNVSNFNVYLKNTKTLLEYLDNGIIDFAIVEGQLNSKEYSINKLMTDEFIVVASKNHKFKNNIKNLSDLLEERLIIREGGSGTLTMLSNILNMQNICISDFKNKIQVDNMSMLVEFLKNDCGVAFLYRSAVKQELESGELVQLPIDDFKIEHDFSFIFNKNSVFSDYYLKIYNFFKIINEIKS